MISNRQAITIFLIFVSFLCEQSQGKRSITFKDGTSRFSPKYFNNFSLTTKEGKVYVDMFVIKILEPGYKANVAVQLRLNNSRQYQTLFAYTLDVCNVITAMKDTIFKKWFQSMLKYGNLMPNCPVEKGHFYLNGWTTDASMVPNYLYPGDYRLKGYVFTGRYQSKNEGFILEIAVDALIA